MLPSTRKRPNETKGSSLHASRLTCLDRVSQGKNEARNYSSRHSSRQLASEQVRNLGRWLRKASVFKFLRFEKRSRKAPFSWRISVEGRPSLADLDTLALVWISAVSSLQYPESLVRAPLGVKGRDSWNSDCSCSCRAFDKEVKALIEKDIVQTGRNKNAKDHSYVPVKRYWKV